MIYDNHRITHTHTHTHTSRMKKILPLRIGYKYRIARRIGVLAKIIISKVGNRFYFG